MLTERLTIMTEKAIIKASKITSTLTEKRNVLFITKVQSPRYKVVFT